MRKEIILLIVLLTPFVCSAQYAIKKLDSKKDFGNDLVYSTFKDSKGRFWFGTKNSLCLNTGNQLFRFQSSFKNRASILPGLVFVLQEDQAANIWAGTYARGITIFNPSTNTYKHLTKETHEEIFYEANLMNIEKYGKDSFRLYTSKGAYVINTTNLSYRKFYDAEILMSIAAGTQEFFLTEKEGLLAYVNGKLDTLVKPNPKQSTAMRIDRAQGVFYISAANGLFKLDDKRLVKCTISFQGKDISDDMFNGVLQDKQETLYINSAAYGTLRITSISNNMISCSSLSKENWYEKGNTIYSSLYDKKEDAFFIGSTLAFYTIKKKKDFIKEIVSDEVGTIKALHMYNKTLFLGTESGIFKKSNNSIQRLANHNAKTNPKYITSFFPLSNQLYAAGNGLYKVSQGVSRHIGVENVHLEKNVQSATLGNKTVLICEQFGKYLVLDSKGMVSKSEKIVFNETIYPPIIPIRSNEVLYHSYSGAYLLDIASAQNQKVIKDVRVNDMVYKQKKIYLATNTNGIIILDDHYKKIDSIDLSMIGLQNQVNSLIVKEGFIWFSNSTGIGSINTKTKKINFLESGDAFETSNFGYSVKYDGGDSIYFGGENGVVIINTKRMNELKQDFNTFIMLPAVYRDGKRYSLTSAQEENLSYNQNNLEYQIVHTNYTYPSSVKFQYRLKKSMPWMLIDKSGLLKLYNLPPDHYKIEVKDMNTGDIVDARSFTIHPPWYQTWLFRIILGLLIIANIIYITRLYYRRRMIAQQKEIEKQKALQEERDRISHDMHDDLGSGLSTIKMIGEMLKSKYPNEEETQQEVNDIIAQADKLNLSMREMVWSLNPREDSLANFIFYIQVYLRKFYAPSTIELTLDFPEDVADLDMKGALRRNLLLCIKEINNNIIKHAQATEVKANIQIDLERNMLTISTEDNGIGLKENVKENNGFTTMRTRIENSGGKIEWQKRVPGTLVKFSVPIV